MTSPGESAQENQHYNQRCHLHLHTEYSLLDGAIRISDAIKKAKAESQPALAITDHGNMYGAVEFYSKCKDAGIKPILGAELYWQGTSATQELRKELNETGKEWDGFHLVVLAATNEGYQNLCRLVSYGYLDDPQSEIPIVTSDRLRDHTTGLITLSSCLKGEFAYLVRHLVSHAQLPLAAELAEPTANTSLIVKALREHVALMQELFAENRYYIELIDNHIPAQQQLLADLVTVARFFDLPMVATADAHYLDPDDAEAHAVMTAVKNDLSMSDLRRRNKSARFHMLSTEEFNTIYAAWPEALANQIKIADACDVTLTFGKYFLPSFEIEGEPDVGKGLEKLAKKGLDERLEHLKIQYGKDLDEQRIEDYYNRLSYELSVINSMGFPGYFLIVQDFINWAKDHDIPVGPGRGSGAGSLVAYALRITDLDPLRFNLIFERFLNPERVSMPDFDVDFCQDRRDEVIQYVTRKYGSENVAQITTFGKMKAKAAIRDVGRVLELGYTRVDKIAKLIPNELDIKLQEALDREPRILEETRKDERIETLIRLALKCEGLSRHTSVHAAGVVISEGGMENYVPVYKGEDGALITQYEMKNAEKVGLVKFDFLGLKTLTVIKKAVDLIRESDDADFDIDSIDLECKPVYDLISSAQSVGIFQLESSGMQALLRKLQPSRFEDIIAVVALFRPGPLGSGMVDDFIERKHGRQEISYLHPSLETILDDTYGIILYQEQVQKIAATLASYSLGEADLLRRAMGKKKPEEMAKQKARFLSGAKKNNIDEAIAEELFELMAKFAAYGFNKSHSAAYGLVSYQTAFLKTFYPEQFMAAIMTCDLDNTEKIVRYIEEVRRMGFAIYPPDINRSSLEFDVPKKRAIGYGLAAIKGVGGSSIEAIIVERQRHGKYTSLTDLARRVNLHKVGKKTLELLIQAGALDCFGATRAAITALIPEIVRYSESHHGAKAAGQRLLFDGDDCEDELADLAPIEDKLRSQPNQSLEMDWLLKEKKMLGTFLSTHPLDLFQNDCKRFGQITIKDIPKSLDRKEATIVCMLGSVSERLTKSGKKMAYLNLEDATGTWEAVMFEAEIPDEYPPENSLVVARVKIGKSFDGVSINVRVESIQALHDVRCEMIRKAKLAIHSVRQPDPNQLQEQQKLLRNVSRILQTYPGKTPLTIELCFDGGQVLIDGIVPQVELSDDFCQHIRGLENLGIGFHY